MKTTEFGFIICLKGIDVCCKLDYLAHYKPV